MALGPGELHLAVCQRFSAAVRAADGKWHHPSPCAGWDARDVLEHVIGFHDVLLLRPLGLKPQRPGDDPGRRWSLTLDRLEQALRRDGLFEQVVEVPVPESHLAVAGSYSPIDESTSAKMEGSMTVAGSRLDARSAADEGSKPPVKAARMPAPSAVRKEPRKSRSAPSTVKSAEVKLLLLRSPAWSAATKAWSADRMF